MILRGTKNKVRGLSATLGAFAVVSTGIALTSARPASAQEIERVLAGIRLNSKSSSVLAKFGNPNEVVIGDVGVRGFGPSGQPGGQGGSPGDGGAPGGDSLPGVGGAGGGGKNFPGARGFGGGAPPGGTLGAAPPGGGGFGAPQGVGGPPPGASGSFGGPPQGGGFGGAPGGEGDFGGGGAGSSSGAIGPFGQSVSTLARQQEVTWIYNRKINNNVVSYNFLIGPNGNVVQILVSGYSGGNSKTKKGIGLGSTYKDVVRVYGYPEEHAIIGRTLIA